MRLKKDDRILPHSVPLQLHYFRQFSGGFTLSFIDIDAQSQFENFVRAVLVAQKHHRHLPVIRLSDGEFKLLFGIVYDSYDANPFRALCSFIRQHLSQLIKRGSFTAGTRRHVSSGNYARNELVNIRKLYPKYLRQIATKGFFCLHLTHGSLFSFNEKYFSRLRKFFISSNIELKPENYIPFYFVYALLSSPHFSSLLNNSRILLIHSATGSKKSRINNSLLKYGPLSITWHAIDSSKSFYNKIYIDNPQSYNLVLFGAGVGKPALISQLSELCCPCIDAGYMFEVWADGPQIASLRPYCITDQDLSTLNL